MLEKIQIYWAPNVQPAFATASELRDSLLASYPDAKETGLPLVRQNGDIPAPAWGWVRELLRKRTDWQPALGIALQHAATDGGEIAQTAFVELLAHVKESLTLLPWTEPTVKLWPERRPLSASACGWGRRLDEIVRDQKNFLAIVRPEQDKAFLLGYGVGGQPIKGPMTNERELRALLAESAQAGQSPGGDSGPWSWMAGKILIGDAWLPQAFERIVHTLDHDNPAMVFALLDWFSEEQDLARFVNLLQGWQADPPSWWSTPAETTPSGWKRNMRNAHWPNMRTLGDVASETLRRATHQVATPPTVDLPLLYGATHVS